MPKVFISYRRADTEDITARIYDRLKANYGAENVVFDIDDVPLAADFREYLHGQVVQCDVLLAIIGRDWISATDDDDRRRLDDPRDYLRIEIESAVHERKPVVPVLVRQARMPEEAQLPESLAFLAYINAARVSSGRDFEVHVERLIRGLDKLLEKAQQASSREARRARAVGGSPRSPEPRGDGVAGPPATSGGSAEGTGAHLLEHLKIASADLLPNTTWKTWRGRKGWWTLGSKTGFHLIRAKPTRNTLRVRVRKNRARSTRARANSTGWIYVSPDSIARDHLQLDRALEQFKQEWL